MSFRFLVLQLLGELGSRIYLGNPGLGNGYIQFLRNLRWLGAKLLAQHRSNSYGSGSGAKLGFLYLLPTVVPFSVLDSLNDAKQLLIPFLPCS